MSEQPDYTGMSEPDLYEALGADATKWAAAFNQTAIKLGYPSMDEGWLTSWFANAMMAQQDFLFPDSKPVRLPDGSGFCVG